MSLQRQLSTRSLSQLSAREMATNVEFALGLLGLFIIASVLLWHLSKLYW